MASEATKALALNPSPEALAIVDSMSRKHKYIQVRNGAKEALKFAAEKFDLTPEQLLDKIVPTLGFDSNGTETFNYGERTFKVTLGCDQQLLVFDQNRKALKTLPPLRHKTITPNSPKANLPALKNLKNNLKRR